MLLDRKILDQHMHIVGDTGSSKTSLGVAPLSTQLIARKDCGVVVVDLKGIVLCSRPAPWKQSEPDFRSDGSVARLVTRHSVTTRSSNAQHN